MQINGVANGRSIAELLEIKRDETQFTLPGNNGQAQVFEIKFVSKDSAYKAGDRVIISPGSGTIVDFEGQRYFVFNNDDVLCTVKD